MKTWPLLHRSTVHIASSICPLVYKMPLEHFNVLWMWSYPVSKAIQIFFLDDIMIFGKTPDQHIDNVPKVLLLQYNPRSRLKLKKCKFYTNITDYLGNVIHPRGLKLVSHITDAIRGLKFLASITRLGSFIGLCNIFTQFVPSLEQIVSTMNQWLRKNQPKTFAPLNSKDICAMETLKNVLIKPRPLELPYSGGHMTLYTDACNVQICCV